MRWAAVCVLLLLFPLAAMAQTTLDDPSQGDADFVPLYVGSVAPEFAERDIFGRHLVDLKDYRGKVVLLNFWATWCPPCRQEIPALEDLQNRYRGKAVVIGASVYCSNTDTEMFYRQYKINYEMIYGSYDLMGKYGKVAGIPTTFIIDSEGRIVTRVIGSRSEAEYEALLKPLVPR